MLVINCLGKLARPNKMHPSDMTSDEFYEALFDIYNVNQTNTFSIKELVTIVKLSNNLQIRTFEKKGIVDKLVEKIKFSNIKIRDNQNKSFQKYVYLYFPLSIKRYLLFDSKTQQKLALSDVKLLPKL